MDIRKYLAHRSYHYYYETLNSIEKSIYAHMLEGFLGFEDTICCSFCEAERLVHIFCCLKWDIPEIFYVSSLSVQYYAENDVICTLLPEYRFDADTVSCILEKMQLKYTPFIASITPLSQYDREKAIHDLLVRSVIYRDPDAPYSHEAAGPLLYGIGVCEGISKAFKYLADRAGLMAVVAVGTCCQTEKEEKHAWNLCEIEGAFYHLDVTFDATIAESGIRYDYLNLSDQEMHTSRYWDFDYPHCADSMNFYRESGLYFPGRQQLIHFFKQQAKSFGRLVFQLPPFLKEKEKASDAVADIAGRYLYGADPAGTLLISSNPDRMVFCIEQDLLP